MVEHSLMERLRRAKPALDRHHSSERPSGSGRVAMILCNASYYGTLAAVRSLGRAGVPVVTVDPAFLAPGRYSRYSSLHLSSPPFESPDWSDWLLAMGRNGPRRAIYATSDAVSFALADRREELSSVFDLYQPDLDTMMCILDKGLLIEHARAVGIDTPETWFPQSGERPRQFFATSAECLLPSPAPSLPFALRSRAH